ncbi:MAG: hypothetical protein ACK58T_28845, partial [Phycisphaerae bacterium]
SGRRDETSVVELLYSHASANEMRQFPATFRKVTDEIFHLPGQYTQACSDRFLTTFCERKKSQVVLTDQTSLAAA